MNGENKKKNKSEQLTLRSESFKVISMLNNKRKMKSFGVFFSFYCQPTFKAFLIFNIIRKVAKREK